MLFRSIKKQQPKRLYIAADGPRANKPGEAEKCQKVRDLAKQVDWDCELKTLFREKNYGCGRAVSGAISWFFENEEMEAREVEPLDYELVIGKTWI